MDVSIVIPAYDAAATLATAIESALDQPGVTREVIVVDDGSRDATLEIARRYAGDVRILTGANAGVSMARNRGITVSSGAYLVFLDADDVLESGTLATRVAAARAQGADVVICKWRDAEDRDGALVAGRVRAVDEAALAADAELACASHVWATTAAILYSRSVVHTIGGFRQDLPVIQDARFLFDAARSGAQFACIDHVGAFYRIVADSLSRRDPARFWTDVFENGRQIAALWRQDGPLPPARRKVLAGIFDMAARGLLSAGSSRYLEAVAELSQFAGKMPLHPRLAGPMARWLGVAPARRVMALIGR